MGVGVGTIYRVNDVWGAPRSELSLSELQGKIREGRKSLVLKRIVSPVLTSFLVRRLYQGTSTVGAFLFDCLSRGKPSVQMWF